MARLIPGGHEKRSSSSAEAERFCASSSTSSGQLSKSSVDAIDVVAAGDSFVVYFKQKHRLIKAFMLAFALQ